MAEINVMAAWNTCKALIAEGKRYVDEGYRNVQDNCGKNKMQKFLRNNSGYAPEEGKQPGELPKEIASALKTEFSKIIEFIDMYLLQDKTDGNSEFLGTLLVDSEMDIDFNIRAVVSLEVDKRPFRILFNPMMAEHYSINELIAEVKMELVHLIYLHPMFYKQLNPHGDPNVHNNLEIGSSVAASELMKRDMGLSGSSNRMKLHDNVYTRSDLEMDIAESINSDVKSTESLQYYAAIADAYRKKSGGNGGSGNGNGQGIGGQGNGQNQSNGGNGQGTATDSNGAGRSPHSWENISSPDDLKEDMLAAIKHAYDNVSDRSRGTMSSRLVEAIEALFKKPQISWSKVFAHMVGIIPYGHKPARTRPNRRQPERTDLHGTLTDRTVRVVACIDTSGSMSTRDIEYVFNEIFGVLKTVKYELTIIECDAAVGRVYKAKKPGDIKPNVTGRGGTSFVPAIEYINEHKFKDAVMVYFTDGYGDYSIPKPKTYRNLWVVLEDESCLSVKEPYGKVMSLKKDEKYLNRRY